MFGFLSLLCTGDLELWCFIDKSVITLVAGDPEAKDTASLHLGSVSHALRTWAALRAAVGSGLHTDSLRDTPTRSTAKLPAHDEDS